MVSAKKSSREAGSAQVQPEPKKTKSVARILIAIVLAIFAYEVFSNFKGNGSFFTAEPQKDFMVRKIVEITQAGKPLVPINAWGVVSLGKNKLVISDNRYNHLLVFDRKGNFIRSWGKRGSGPTEFNEPCGLVTDGKGHVYVLDTWNAIIKGFDENGRSVLQTPLSDPGFFGPRGLAWDGKNFVIPDASNNRIVLISPKGEVTAVWGKKGNGVSDFSAPVFVANDKKGNYLVADSGNHRLQWLDPTGKAFKIIKYKEVVTAVAVDNENRFYVESGDDDWAIRAYSPEGKYLGDLKDENPSGRTIRAVHWMSISDDDVLHLTISDNSVVLYQLPPQQ